MSERICYYTRSERQIEVHRQAAEDAAFATTYMRTKTPCIMLLAAAGSQATPHCVPARTPTMGLDTSHDCWHGPYSAFMRWRTWLNLYVMQDRADAGDERAKEIAYMGATDEAIKRAWAEGHYIDQSVPINVLMNHSDCEGEIPSDVCGPLADALQDIVERRMPGRALYDEKRPATERFIQGLREAAAAGEAVDFH